MLNIITHIEKTKNQLNNLHWADKYLIYLKFRNQGLKKQAQAHLKGFFTDFTAKNKKDRREFVDIVCKMAFFTGDYSTYLPVNLYKGYFLTELIAWANDEPLNPIPFKWSDNFDNNKKSIELDSNDQIALEKFAQRLIGKISMNQHEVKRGYVYDGDPNEDISSIVFFENFIGKIEDVKRKEEIRQLLTELRHSAMEYKESRK